MKQNMVYLIKNPMSMTQQQYEVCFQNLPTERKNKAAKYKVYKDRLLSVLAGALLTYALRESFQFSDVPAIIEGERGKPMLKDHPEIYFNLSHCQSAVACAVSTGEVGIDVQESRESLAKIAKRYFSEQENRMIVSAEDDAMRQLLYRRVWTLKEAYGKYTGKGLFYDMRRKNFSSLLQEKMALPLIACTFDQKQILLMDEQSFSMAVYADLPMSVMTCDIDALCEGISRTKI